MADLNMAEEDEFGRPIRFTPTWPPRPVEKSVPVMTPAFSLAFRKAGWPPKVNDDEQVQSISSDTPNGGEADVNSNKTPAGPHNDEKPRKARRDYSAFFAKNAAPPTRPVYILQPGQVSLPEAFTAGETESDLQ